MAPTLRQIEAFLAVAETGSFSGAATRLDFSQPALSGAVRDLEAALGVRLIDRTSRRVERTAAGARFRATAGHGIDEIARAIRSARAADALREGTIRVAAPPLLAATVVPRAIAAFAADHPGVRCALSDSGTEEIVARLRDGRAHRPWHAPGRCARGRAAAGPARSALRRRAVRASGARGAAGLDPAGRLAAGGPVARERNPRAGRTRLRPRRHSPSPGLGVRPAWEVTQVATALALVAEGLAVAVLPGYAVAAAALPGIGTVPLAGPPVLRELAVLLPRDRSGPPATAAFAEALARAARSLGPR